MVKFGNYRRMIRYSDSEQNEILGSDGWYIPDQRLSNANMLQNAIDKIRNQKAAFLAQAVIGENRYINPKAEFVTLMQGTNYINAKPIEEFIKIFPERILFGHEQALLIPVANKNESIERLAIVPENSKNFQIEELQKLLNCEHLKFIELLPTFSTQNLLILIVDVEAKFNDNSTINLDLVLLLSKCYPGRVIDTMFGKAIICKPELIK